MDDATRQRIQSLVADNTVMVFMKGTKHFPQCGFSASVVEALRRTGHEFETFNVLEDPVVRQGIKEFTNWPTIPQVYVRGEFIGGCDIVREMFESGELQRMLDEATP